MITWIALNPMSHPDQLGFIPFFLDENNPASAREQLDAGYQHGGGWRPFKGFTMLSNDNLEYPGDPPTRPLFETTLRHETVRVYESSWVAIIQPDGSFEVCRMD